jgi:hypothetical protein
MLQQWQYMTQIVEARRLQEELDEAQERVAELEKES